jgi:hypothetical protein
MLYASTVTWRRRPAQGAWAQIAIITNVGSTMDFWVLCSTALSRLTQRDPGVRH